MQKGKVRRIFLLGLMVILLTSSFGQAAEIWLKNKRRIQGEVLLDTPDRVVVRLRTGDVEMGTVELTRDEIEKIIYTKEELRKRHQGEYEAKVAELAPSDAQARYALALWCTERKLLEEAAEQLEKAVELKEGFFEAYGELGQVQLQLGRHAAAVRSWEKTRALKPDDEAVKKNLVKVYGEIAKTLLSEKKYAEALRLLEKLEKELPLSKKLLASRKKAKRYLKEAGEHFQAGERHFEKEDYVQAREEYGKALELNTELLEKVTPHLDACNLKLGAAAYAEQDYRESIEYYEGYIEVRPELVEVVERLCGAYVELGLEAYRNSDFQEAARLLRQSVTLRPSDPAAHFYLALVYFSQGKYKDALAEVTQAVQRSALLGEAENLQAQVDAKLKAAKSARVAAPTAPKTGGFRGRPSGDKRSPGRPGDPDRRGRGRPGDRWDPSMLEDGRAF